MTSVEKLFNRFLNHPVGLSYVEMERALIYVGFRKIFAKGSHVKFKHCDLRSDLIIPVHGNDCKSFYKIYASKIVKKLMYEKSKN